MFQYNFVPLHAYLDKQTDETDILPYPETPAGGAIGYCVGDIVVWQDLA